MANLFGRSKVTSSESVCIDKRDIQRLLDLEVLIRQAKLYTVANEIERILKKYEKTV